MWRCACALALLCSALARTSTFKRAEMSTVPFVLGSRYGRSPPRMIAPRNDRFFMGSRYGKRSETALRTSLRALQVFPDVTWRDIASLCDVMAFSPLCSRQQVPPKPLNNRIDQEALRVGYED